MSLTIGLLIAASATAASKDYLAHDPALAGSKIEYCEAPKNCKLIDRRSEAVLTNLAAVSSNLAVKLSEIAPEFRTLTVTFKSSDDAPRSFDMQLRYSQDPSKKADKK